MSESAIMLDFDHPNVLKLLGVCLDAHDDLPLIVLPFMANGDLKTFLVNKRGDEEINLLPKVLNANTTTKTCYAPVSQFLSIAISYYFPGHFVTIHCCHLFFSWFPNVTSNLFQLFYK